ncbi:MAG TPA: type II toxin-antitoxin system VapC family toxin [Candidatus Hydrogenedentes bacterium]|nr:type II toxin-antitoxin system VapC family toxin [Candidatus Hydrogenedentota bacterium]HIJ74992.1 type II toxin-antitoxin system VapC family toxin [Candidatus Hydrogenedentota bacterium]
MKIVADTNAFLVVALEEPEKGALIALTAGHDLIAPEVLPFEVGNALTTLMRRRRLRPDQLTSVWEAAQRIPVELRRIDVRSALVIAGRFGIYAYDAYFIECAIHSRAPLLTLDQQMIRVARELSVETLELEG